MNNKICNIVVILFVWTVVYYMLGNRIKSIRERKTNFEKLIASFYYSSQITTTVGLLNIPSDLIVMIVINIHILLVFYITLF